MRGNHPLEVDEEESPSPPSDWRIFSPYVNFLKESLISASLNNITRKLIELTVVNLEKVFNDHVTRDAGVGDRVDRYTLSTRRISEQA